MTQVQAVRPTKSKERTNSHKLFSDPLMCDTIHMCTHMHTNTHKIKCDVYMYAHIHVHIYTNNIYIHIYVPLYVEQYTLKSGMEMTQKTNSHPFFTGLKF